MFAKLFSRITESSIMEEPLEVRYSFMMLLAMCDPTGHVIGTDIAIARRMNLPVVEFRKCVEALMQPDPDSNSKEEEGRRVTLSTGERGYFVVNYLTYRDMKTEENRREYMRDYMRKRREAEAVASCKQPVKRVKPELAPLGHAEGELTAEKEGGGSAPLPPLAERPSESEFIAECKRHLVPEWFARDKFLQKDTAGWEPKGNWRSHVRRVKGWFEQAGRPMTAPINGKNGNHKPYEPNI
jgi:hypothetical protein